jgi:cytochrome P450
MRAHQDLADGDILVRRVPCSAIPNLPLKITRLATTMAAAEVDQQVPCDDGTFDIDNSAAVISDSPAKIYEEYRYLRKHCPVIHTSQYGGYWLMTRYEDVKRAAMDSETYISSVKAVVPSDPRGLRRPPLNFDAPAHTPFRTALERTVKPARIRRLKASLYEHAEAQLAPLLSRGHGDISATLSLEWRLSG